MVKYIFVIILFGILSFTHQVNSKENTIDNFYKDFYFTEYGTIMLNDKQGKENEVKQDLYIFAPLNKNGGYYVGSANFRKYLLTVGSEGYVYLFDKNSSGERRCIFKKEGKVYFNTLYRYLVFNILKQ